jgi:uncharacterized protein YbjT (DUF2867 family)
MILITGATGNTGRALVEQLASRGVPVRALVRDRTTAGGLALPGVELVVGDLGRPETLAPALAGIRTAYLLSAADPDQVRLHSNFIEVAARAGVGHIVRQSVRGADAASLVKLARWHAASQQQLEESGMAWTHLQPLYNMQNFFRLAASIQSAGAFFAPMREAALSMVDARDVADVAAAVLTGHGHEGKTYVVTGPESLTFAAAARHLSSALGRAVRYADVTPEVARSGLLSMGLPGWYVDDLLQLYVFYSSGAGAVVTDAVPRLAGHAGRSFAQFAGDYRAVFDDRRQPDDAVTLRATPMPSSPRANPRIAS